VERDKEEDGFVRLGLEETEEGDTVGGARLTIETGTESRFSRTFDDPEPPIRAAILVFSGILGPSAREKVCLYRNCVRT
jgi:hypothetical protein